jgi:drug/metabolite transporter (DMT)-like permease
MFADVPAESEPPGRSQVNSSPDSPLLLPVPAATERDAHAPFPLGVFWALLTVVIWGAWPVYTRLSVITALTPHDLVALRYAIGGAILLPVLVRLAPRMPAFGWREGVILAFCQGAPLALLVTLGTQYAPASHMAALSPGILPLFAAALAFIFFNERLARSRVAGLGLILAGALVIAGVSLASFASGVWRGDAMFVCAGFLGSIYTIRMRRSGLTALQGAALMAVYSMLAYLPLYAWFWAGASRLAEAPLREVLFQGFYQGVLMGALTLFSLSRAVVILGATRAGTFLSLLPVIATVLGAVVLHEFPSPMEMAAVVAISAGVFLAAGAWQRG